MIGSLLKLASLPQKIALGAGAAALASALAFNVVQLIENRNLSAAKSRLVKRIDDPKTGYVVMLTQARTNVAQCTTAIERQNTKIRRLSTDSAATVASVQKRYDVEHVARVRAESAASAILAHKPQGNTLIERMNDVDAQILGDLK